VGMGVLPLQFKTDENPESLGLDGSEIISISGIKDLEPFSEVQVIAKKRDESEIRFKTIARLESKIDIEYYKNGGILQTVLRDMIKNNFF
jgi:aconitate hydratase